MHIAILSIRFYLHGCLSKKDKRQRLVGLKDKFGKATNIAVCESDFQDDLNQSEYCFVATAADKQIVESSLAKIVDHCRGTIDAEITQHNIEWL